MKIVRLKIRNNTNSCRLGFEFVERLGRNRCITSIDQKIANSIDKLGVGCSNSIQRLHQKIKRFGNLILCVK